MATDDREVRGILPLFLVAVPMFGSVLASGSYESYGGLLTSVTEVEKPLLEVAASLTVSSRSSYLEIKNDKEISEIGSDWKKKKNYCRMILDLGCGADLDVWKK